MGLIASRPASTTDTEADSHTTERDKADANRLPGEGKGSKGETPPRIGETGPREGCRHKAAGAARSPTSKGKGIEHTVRVLRRSSTYTKDTGEGSSGVREADRQATSKMSNC